MTTLVGTQSNFADAIKELVELDYDAIEAYKSAIDKITNNDYKEHLQQFKADHERHVQQLNAILRGHGQQTIDGPSNKQWLTKGKVVLANLFGDDSIMQAMRTNEEDTNTAYERINNHADKWQDAVEVLKQGLLDEKKHKKWIEEHGGAPSL